MASASGAHTPQEFHFGSMKQCNSGHTATSEQAAVPLLRYTSEQVKSNGFSTCRFPKHYFYSVSSFSPGCLPTLFLNSPHNVPAHCRRAGTR